MYLRLTVVGVLFIVCAPLRAQELQFTLSGEGCLVSDCTSPNPPPQVPITLTFDVNTSAAQLTPLFITFNGTSYLAELDVANMPIQNFTAMVNGQNLAIPAAFSNGEISLVCESGPTSCANGTGDFNLGFEASAGKSGFSMAGSLIPSFTQAQYQAFSNPLFSILSTSDIGTPIDSVTDASGTQYEFGAPTRVTVVPEPGTVTLLLLGLFGIGFARLRRT